MKLYDKEIYKLEKTIKSILWIITVFLIGFITGYSALDMESCKEREKLKNDIDVLQECINEQSTQIQKQSTDIDSYKETIYMLETYGK